ncbi:MAG: hypothetical protein A2293_00770 [Elusimicrobia bacterium RIFOXYB2_FULL_49_7]|nr:MAG: hypothetical protein A2293_00770 [Elusimicrobia bacterium RIFOXYB2_FULL_49_7]
MTGDPKIAKNMYGSRLKLGGSLFLIFFIYYMGVAILNTPTFQATAAIPVVGMPLGMFLTLLVFPFSWLLLTVYLILWR